MLKLILYKYTHLCLVFFTREFHLIHIVGRTKIQKSSFYNYDRNNWFRQDTLNYVVKQKQKQKTTGSFTIVKK